MGRNVKTGLDYFPFEVDFFGDIKIRKLIKYQGGKAVTIYALLLCIIYKDGYYARWDEELPFIVSEQTGFEEAYISEVIKSCLALGLFSKELFDAKKILTSKGIQERYIYICNLSKRKVIISPEYAISSEEIIINSEEIPISSEEIPINSVKSTQRKEKESKVNRKKENKSDDLFEKENDSSLFPVEQTQQASKKTTDRFVKPTLQQVQAYCQERNNSIDAEHFMAHYDAVGWKIGKNPMKDWKAAVRTWERNRSTTSANGQSGVANVPQGVTLGVGERIVDGRRTYGTGKSTIPMDAPPRPADGYSWDSANKRWIYQ